jgi:hypothetical protein
VATLRPRADSAARIARLATVFDEGTRFARTITGRIDG